mmetsp:Transcript_1253/g.1891  ORF Transcript_1253/g.1891 Transcript_1253/m.1891 type:complete len:669 (-) Transcript_1253:31-2037(-)
MNKKFQKTTKSPYAASSTTKSKRTASRNSRSKSQNSTYPTNREARSYSENRIHDNTTKLLQDQMVYTFDKSKTNARYSHVAPLNETLDQHEIENEFNRSAPPVSRRYSKAQIEHINNRIDMLERQLDLQEEQEEMNIPPSKKLEQLNKDIFATSLPSPELIELLVKKLALTKLVFGALSTQVVQVIVHLAQIYISMNSGKTSLDHLERAAKLVEEIVKNHQSRTSELGISPHARNEKHQKMLISIFYSMSLNYYRLGKLDEAEEYVGCAQLLNDDIYGPSAIAEHILNKEQEGEGIEEDNESAVEQVYIHESNFPLYMLLGQIYAAKGDSEKAFLYLNQANELKQNEDPHHPLLASVELELGQLYRVEGDFKESVIHFMAARQLTEGFRGSRHIDCAHICYIITDLFCELGEFDKALQHSQIAYEIVNSFQSEQRFHRASFIHWKMHLNIAHAFCLIKNSLHADATVVLENIIRDTHANREADKIFVESNHQSLGFDDDASSSRQSNSAQSGLFGSRSASVSTIPADPYDPYNPDIESSLLQQRGSDDMILDPQSPSQHPVPITSPLPPRNNFVAHVEEETSYEHPLDEKVLKHNKILTDEERCFVFKLLGNVYYLEKRYKEAFEVYRQCALLYANVHSKTHPKVIQIIERLAQIRSLIVFGENSEYD